MFVKLFKTMLMILGALFAVLLVYAKLSGHSHHWNKNTGVDVKQMFTVAYMTMPDGSCRKFRVKSWSDYEFSDQLQFTTEDDITYLTHASRIILTDEKQ